MIRRRRENKVTEGGAPEWIVTYGDMATLLLTFFIMLYSMSVVDKQKFEVVANSLRSTFVNNSNGEIFDSNKGKEIVPSEEVNTIDEEGSLLLANTRRQISSIIENLKMDDKVTLLDTKEELIIRIDSVLLFDVGKAEIKASGKDALVKVGNLLKDLDKEIFVQGHTDNLPINTVEFPTNWELSTKRATNVVLFLIDNCGLDPSKLTATGNGEFRPILPNTTEENRQKNRRTDIVIKK